jgi:hypothetical protein
MLSEESICFTKMATAKKTTVCREGRGVRRFEDNMLSCINERFLFLSMTSPEEENQKITFIGERLYNRVGKSLPSLPSV